MEIRFENLPEEVAKMSAKMDRIERLLSGQSLQTSESDILRPVEAAKFVNLALPTLYTKTSKGEIPHMKKGGRLYFSKTELLEYIRQGRVRTRDEIAAGAMDMIRKGGQK